MRELDSLLQKADATAARQAIAEHPCWAVSLPNSVHRSNKATKYEPRICYLLPSFWVLAFFQETQRNLRLETCSNSTPVSRTQKIQETLVSLTAWCGSSTPFLLEKTLCLLGENHRIIEWFQLEGTFKGHLVQPPCNEKPGSSLGWCHLVLPCTTNTIFKQPRCPLPSWFPFCSLLLVIFLHASVTWTK